MATSRAYSDDELFRAVACSRSWRGVLRELGLAGTSSAAIRSVRTRADEIGADHSHFSGRRRWTEDQLRAAVEEQVSWADVARVMGLTGRKEIATAKGHAARLELPVDHLRVSTTVTETPLPQVENLDRAGSLLAAGWFTLCGMDVSWPMEPSRYDLVVRRGEEFRRVQVKTTTARQGSTWKVYLSTTSGERRPYDPDEIDDFFIIDGDLNYYLIPMGVVGGLQAIHLAAYATYLVESSPRVSGPQRSCATRPS